MQSSNDHSPKKAILYARVSTEEQVRSGYSLAQQIEALRQYVSREGYEVFEEVVDPGQSGASLERPGMDRVRDLVAVGGVSVVLAQDRDRIAREPAYHYLLRREFEEYGTKLRALNDRGDDSPEGELTDGILDQLAKYERAKVAERTRRGKLRKAREGRVIRTGKAPFGFRYTKEGDGLLVHEPDMSIVEKIFRYAAESLAVRAIPARLHAEGILAPKGGQVWNDHVLRRLIANDIYRPHTFEEIARLVAPEVAARLNPDERYGIQWFNRKKTSTITVAEPDRNGGRRYRKRSTVSLRPKGEWIAVPIPACLSRALVDRARRALKENSRSFERKHLARGWELRGLVRCSCGSKMRTLTTKSGDGPDYHYYTCGKRRTLGKMCSCAQKSLRAPEIEPKVWAFVSELLTDSEKIRAGMEALIDQERVSKPQDLERQAKAWTKKVDEYIRLRSAYQDQQAAGLMTLQELGAKLEELENGRRVAERELMALRSHQQRVEELEKDRDALLQSMSETVLGTLEDLTDEEKNRLYQMLRLEVTPSEEGYEVNGAFCTSGLTSP
jgi:site-specific DNA recombinase